MEYNLTLLKKI